MKPIRKFWQMAAADATLKAGEGPGTLTGVASVMGNLDSADDVIFPGAYSACLPEFRQSGFVAVGHEWDELPVAIPTMIEERGTALYAECRFHSTDEAQAARTVCQERLAAGLSVGLSVGFLCSPEDCMVFPDGRSLLAFAQANGYDLSLFDKPSILAHKEWCRAILRVARLVEYSIVPIPANGKAQAIAAKAGKEGLTARDYEQILCDAGLTRSEAKRFISGIKSLSRDAETDTTGPSGNPAPPVDPATEQQSAEALAQQLADRLAAHSLSLRARRFTGALAPAGN